MMVFMMVWPVFRLVIVTRSMPMLLSMVTVMVSDSLIFVFVDGC